MAIPVDLTARRGASVRPASVRPASVRPASVRPASVRPASSRRRSTTGATHPGRRRLYAVAAPTGVAAPTRPTSVLGDPVADVHAYNEALARYVLTAAPMGI